MKMILKRQGRPKWGGWGGYSPPNVLKLKYIKPRLAPPPTSTIASMILWIAPQSVLPSGGTEKVFNLES